MTPTQFVALVSPHLPVGDFHRIETASDCTIELKEGGGYHHLTPLTAGRLLLGAIVAEAKHGIYVGETFDGYLCDIFGQDNSIEFSGIGPTPLHAALEAHTRARKEMR